MATDTNQSASLLHRLEKLFAIECIGLSLGLAPGKSLSLTSKFSVSMSHETPQSFLSATAHINAGEP